MNFDLKLSKIVSVLMLTLAMAACGGGSSTTPDPTPIDPTPMPDPAVAERDAISMSITAADTAVGMVTDDATDAQITAAEMAISKARMAIEDAANVPADEKAAYRATVSVIETALANAEASRMAAMNAAADKMRMTMNTLALKQYTGLGPESTTLDDASIRVSNTTGMVSVRPDDSGGVIDLDKKTATPLKAYGAWKGEEYVVETPDMTDHVVLYTDRKAKTELFTTKYSASLTNGRMSIGAANQALVASSEFASGSGGMDHTEQNGDTASIRGSFDGAPGLYQCSQTGGTACRSQVNGEDGIILSGGWTFDPDEDAMATTLDANYNRFAWWSRETATDADVYVVYAGSIGPVGVPIASSTRSVTGTAIYMGAAAGKYAIYDPFGGDSDAGAFTAKAMLTVEFGEAEAPATITPQGTISGMLSEFEAGGMSKDWTVALKGEDGADAAEFRLDGTTGSPETVWSIGGTAAGAAGGWHGQFRGPPPP